ncbi:MAG TPA: alkaline phosphatase family protein [Steroidobacteraceae bacterium]|nr:alkaline phosphatase family protein [Steroidobacteraceae bacterium]
MIDPPRKLLIIGVDAGSPELFRRWCSTGDLPNLGRLLADGIARRVENPRGMEAGAVWPVFHTGLLPGRQPMYDGRRNFDPATYAERWYGPDETMPTVWRQLSDAGLRCVLIDPPYTLVDPRINGVTVMDWGTHVPANGQRFEFRTHPANVAAEILALVGPDPAGGVMCDRMSPESVDEYRRFRDLYLTRIDGKAKLARHLLTNEDWNVALVTSSDLHCAGHHLWHINDRRHPQYSAQVEAELGEPLKDCYRAFDRSLGTILDAVDAGTTVMVFGSHGMGPSFSGTGLLDRILLRLDKGTVRVARHSPKARLRALWHRVPADLRGRLRPLRRPFRGALHPPKFLGDHANRRFFEVYANNASGGVRLNIKGRERSGTVDPADADDLSRFLATELGKVVNADTGEPVVKDVTVTRRVYSGAYLDKLPDLLVTWNRNAPIERVRSDTIGQLSREYLDNRTGDHTPDGICIVHGPGVNGRGEAPAIRTADLAPSIARFFGVELHEHDGAPFDLVSRKPFEREPADVESRSGA